MESIFFHQLLSVSNFKYKIFFIVLFSTVYCRIIKIHRGSNTRKEITPWASLQVLNPKHNWHSVVIAGNGCLGYSLRLLAILQRSYSRIRLIRVYSSWVMVLKTNKLIANTVALWQHFFSYSLIFVFFYLYVASVLFFICIFVFE